MACLNIPSKTTPELDALLRQVNDNRKLIEKKKLSLGRVTPHPHMKLVIAELQKTYTASPAERILTLGRQGACLDYLFRILLGMCSDSYFVYALKVQALCLETFMKSGKIKRIIRKINERNRQNDERNRQIPNSYERNIPCPAGQKNNAKRNRSG